MKKITLFIAAVVVLLQTVSAREISVNEAKSIAERFSATNGLLKSERNLPLNLAYVERTQGMNCVYVFSRGTENGYVVVSGDDRTAPVLGYADNGTVDAENMPENAKWWLGEYARQIQYLNENPAAGAYLVEPLEFTKEVKPLLKSRWDQDAPFNNMCPELNGIRTVVGCAATAAVQIMRFHEWPVKGEGSISYQWQTGRKTITEDFSKVTFDWANMKDFYTSANTEAENKAVAELSYYVGVGAQMNYNIAASGGSGATTVATIQGLYNYFGYDEGMEQLMRDVTGNREWTERLVYELDNNRPIFYAGATGDHAGHAFVFDGYNKDGYFHVNWGWGGMSDGYFLTTALDPMSHGIGGASAGFNFGQTATVGIKAKDSEIKFNPNLFTNGNFSTAARAVAKGGKANFQCEGQLIINALAKTVFKLGIAVYDEKNELVYSLFQTKDYSLNPGYAFNPMALYGMTLPADLAEGKYKIFPAAKFGSDPEVKVIKAPLNMKGYVGMEVTASDIKLTTPKDIVIDIESITPAGKIINGVLASFDVALANNSDGEFYDQLALAIYKPKNFEIAQVFTPVITSLSPGDRSNVHFEGVVTAEAGDYNLALINQEGRILSEIKISVEKGAAKPALTLTKKSELIGTAGIDDATKLPLVNKNDLTYRAFLTNTGGYFSGKIYMKVWEAVQKGSNTQWKQVAEYNQILTLDTDEYKEILFNVQVPNLEIGKKYRCSLYQESGEIKSSYGRAMFIATDQGGSVESVESAKIAVYPNPVMETLNVVAPENIKSVEIFSLLGTKVADVRGESPEQNIDVTNLLPSAYIVVVTAEDGSRLTQKIIKK